MSILHKKILLPALFCLFSVSITAQQDYRQSELHQLSVTEQNQLISLPSLELPLSYKNKSIPYKVDHSQSEHFRDMFTQSGMSCGQASSTGICFTYEMNAARNLQANANANLYPTHFVYNWDNGDWGGLGVSYYHTFEVLRTVGTPNQEEYGGTIDAGGNLRWMTGYDLYYSSMHNRISHAYKIDVGDEDGLAILKHWMTDHLNGDDDGGCAVFYSTVPYPNADLPTGTEEAGKKVITTLSANTSHSMAILGFNDSIRYDYNNDGQYTNDIDITGDGQVTMADWEIGGIKMCNTYSGGPAWADGGFCYIMYKALATGAFWQDLVHVMTVNPTYEPQLTAKVNITYTNRKRIKVIAGLSTNTSANMPEYVLDIPIFEYQGGERYMTGGEEEIDKTLEFGLDLTPLLNYIDPNQEAKYFIQIFENDNDGWGSGTLNSFSVINYSTGSPVETACPDPAQTILQNGITTMSIVSAQNYDPVEITTTALLTGSVLSSYSQQLVASGGSIPYTWSFDMDFDVSESIGSFPTSGTTTSGSGFFAIPLGFDFIYYGETYNTIYVSNEGLVVFQSGFSDVIPYGHHDETVFMHTKCIAPFYLSGLTSTLKTITGTGYKTIIWDNSSIDFAMTIFENGNIELIYDNANINNQSNYVCGVSNGDEISFQRLDFDDPNNIPSGYKYTLIPFSTPDEFEISSDGLLTGFPTHEYTAEDFHFKVIDNNGIIDKITLPFVTDGLILSYSVSTADDDIIEYSESANISLTVVNPLSSNVTGITITASTVDPYITLTDNTQACPNLSPAQTADLTNAFAFDISADVPDNYQFQINFEVTCDQDIWQYFYTFTAYSPNILTGTITIDDSNDDILAAGETADIYIPISNTGGSDIHNLTATATTSDPYIIINTNQDNILSLEPAASNEISFNISSENEVENQHTATINISITGDNGYQTEIPIEIVINTAILSVSYTNIDDGDNECLDPGETSDVIFMLQNTGLVGATNISAALTSEDPMITINTTNQTIPSLSAGNSTPLTYNITIDPTCDMAHQAELELQITADNGLSINVPCYLIIGILTENFETGNLETFEWSHTGDVPWFVVTDVVYDGAYSLKSGDIIDSQSSKLEIQMYVVADGEISFARKVSSENNYDFFEFLIDGIVKTSLSGEQNWDEFSCPVTTGQHTFTWRYRKDNIISAGSDAAWIDDIVFPAVNNVPPILTCTTSEIFKTMNTNQTESDPLIISNTGGGICQFEIDVIPINSKSKNIDGTNITADPTIFVPGSTMDITFTLNAVSNDYEWIKHLLIEFPEGVNVNSSTDLIGPSGSLTTNAATGAGADIIWTTTEMWGQIHQNETATCTVNVTFDEEFTANECILACTISGDEYGEEPHTINTNIVLEKESNFWLTVNPNDGEIMYSSDFELSLNYNTADMSEGVYYANIIINDGITTISIPVELTIDFTSSANDLSNENNIKVFPNPFNDIFTIEHQIDATNDLIITIYDVTGKSIYLPRLNPSGNDKIVLDGNELKPGFYMLRINNGLKTDYVKIIKN
ncbi:MAG: T9SS type A sorting domain-containing protein [Clostridia bacterium]|nr:T9SS type A sorting domain-containing protein [Clostridia bacterium]